VEADAEGRTKRSVVNSGGLGPCDLRRLPQLEEENQKLKRLVADLSMDKALLQEVPA
jgi:putative transposase